LRSTRLKNVKSEIWTKPNGHVFLLERKMSWTGRDDSAGFARNDTLDWPLILWNGPRALDWCSNSQLALSDLELNALTSSLLRRYGQNKRMQRRLALSSMRIETRFRRESGL
jgi:hypothetical protein